MTVLSERERLYLFTLNIRSQREECCLMYPGGSGTCHLGLSVGKPLKKLPRLLHNEDNTTFALQYQRY